MGASGKAVGKQYLQRVQDYLARTPELPVGDDGGLNITEISEHSGVPRQSFYKNPGVRSALAEARKARGVSDRLETSARSEPADENQIKTVGASDKIAKKTKVLERRVTQLEQQNASLVAENAELRRQLKAMRLRYGREDMLIETGRRIPMPPDEAHG